MSIGTLSAETDDNFLFECFIDHPAVAASQSVKTPGMVVSGRTGAGKTAILRYVEHNSERYASIEPSDMALSYVSNSDILRFVQSIGGDLDLLFLALWKHVLCIEFIRLRYHVSDEVKSKFAFSKLFSRFSGDARKRKSLNYLKEWEGKFWITMDQNIKDITEKYENQLHAELGAEVQKFKAGGQYEKRISNEKKTELVARAKKIINAEQLSELAGVIEMLGEESSEDGQGKFYILIDKLDDRWVDVSIRFKLIRSLIEALKSFRRIKNLKVLVALRSDILERVVQETGDLTFQREKFDDYFIKLKWSKKQLRDLVQKRIGLLFRRQYTISAMVMFEDVFPYKVGNMDPFEYMLERTLMRPRDIITFVNECLSAAEGRFEVSAKIIRDVEGEYSRIRRQALEYEWQSAFPNLQRLLDFLTQFRKVNIDFGEMCTKDKVEELALPMTEKRVDYDPLFDQATKLFSKDGDHTEFMRVALSILYRVGAVGIKPHSDERIFYSHVDQPVYDTIALSQDARIRIHPMLHRALGIEGRRFPG